jgi:hypothetical protein
MPLTLTLPMIATIRLTSVSKLMGLSHRIQKQMRLLEEGTPPHLMSCTLAHRMGPNFLRQTRERNSCRFKNCRPSTTKSKSACAYFSRTSSGSVRRVHMAEELERELMTSIVTSLRIGRANP